MRIPISLSPYIKKGLLLRRCRKPRRPDFILGLQLVHVYHTTCKFSRKKDLNLRIIWLLVRLPYHLAIPSYLNDVDSLSILSLTKVLIFAFIASKRLPKHKTPSICLGVLRNSFYKLGRWVIYNKKNNLLFFLLLSICPSAYTNSY